MIKFLKWLFCRHKKLTFVRNIYGDEINAAGGCRSWWKCDNCDQYILKGALHDGTDSKPPSV